MFIPALIISLAFSTDRETGPAWEQLVSLMTWYQSDDLYEWGEVRCASRLTDCADDASVAWHRGLRINVQQTHVLNESVRHSSMELLGVDHVLRLWHGCDCVCRKCPEKTTNQYSFTCSMVSVSSIINNHRLYIDYCHIKGIKGREVLMDLRTVIVSQLALVDISSNSWINFKYTHTHTHT